MKSNKGLSNLQWRNTLLKVTAGSWSRSSDQAENKGVTRTLSSSYTDQWLSTIKLKLLSTTYQQGVTDKLSEQGGEQTEQYLFTEYAYKSNGVKDIPLQWERREEKRKQ